MRVARVIPVVAAVLAAAVLQAHANPMGRGGGGGGGGRGGGAIGVGAAIGTAIAVGGFINAMDEAAQRRDAAIQNGLAEGHGVGKKAISEEEYARRMNDAYAKLRSRPKNQGISDERLQEAVMKAMDDKYRIAKPERYDNDAAFERGRVQNREMIRINSRGQLSRPGAEANNPYRLKKSGMNQQEHDLLYKPGTKATGEEW